YIVSTLTTRIHLHSLPDSPCSPSPPLFRPPSARRASNRPRALVLICHVLAHFPSLCPVLSPPGAMAALLQSRYGSSAYPPLPLRSEEQTSELPSPDHLVLRLFLYITLQC